MIAALTGLLVPLGILFSQDVLRSSAFQFLSAFVAVNTLMYVTLAAAKMLPKVYLSDWSPRRRRRSETRSIHAGGPSEVGAPVQRLPSAQHRPGV
jgi:hypothetical protein